MYRLIFITLKNYKLITNSKHNKMENKFQTIEELSHDTFYGMQKYSQLVIDLVSEFEDFELNNNEDLHAELSAMNYHIDNILEIIDKTRVDDIAALKSLKKFIDDLKKSTNQ